MAATESFQPVIEMTFWNNHKYTLTALALTLLAALVVTGRAEWDASLLAVSGVMPQQVQLVYGILAVILALLLPVESPVRRALRGRPAVLAIAAVLSVAAGVTVVRLMNPVQDARTFQFPYSLGIIIIHVVGMSALVLMFLTDEPLRAPDKRLKQIVTLTLVVYAAVLVLAHLAGVPDFMSMDTPDEPWLASMATNYAENGQLSPSFIASSHGTPDPVLPRYYLLMGWWIRLVGDSSLTSLRLFPLLVAGVGAAIFLLIVRRVPTLAGRLAGLVALLGASAFVRTSHNLRMDVGLIIFSGLLLWGLLALTDPDSRKKTIALLLGLTLYVGLEVIPTLAFVFALAVGLSLVITWLVRHDFRSIWPVVVVYTVGCLLSLAVYAAAHFLPDFADGFDRFRQFATGYTGATSTGALRLPLDTLWNYHTRFSFNLSPVELIAALVVLIGFWRGSSRAEKWVYGTFGLGLTLTMLLVSMSYGYWMVCVPFVAYALARAYRTRVVLLVATFAVLPVFIAAPIFDLTSAAERQVNRKILAEADQYSGQFPSSITIVGEPLFWYTLHESRNFIGWTGVFRYAGVNQLTNLDAIAVLNPDVVICWAGLLEERCNKVLDTGLFTYSHDMVVNGETYVVLDRRP